MTEPIGLAAVLVSFADAALKSTITLCKMIQSFQLKSNHVRTLEKDLDNLSAVLGSLTERGSMTPEIDFSGLGNTRLQHADIRKGFEKGTTNCLSRADRSRINLRDWPKLTYVGEDIDSVRHILAGYKSAISNTFAEADL
jgi:hypothetical protein